MNILDEAKRLTSAQRRRDYGHPRDDFTRTAAAFSALTGIDFKPEWVPLFQICVKLSREVHRHGRDNLVDVCGYAATLQSLYEQPVDPDADVEAAAGCDRVVAAIGSSGNRAVADYVARGYRRGGDDT